MHKKIIITAISFFILGILFNNVFIKNQSVSSAKLDKKVTDLNSPSPTPIPCGRDDKYIETKGASDEDILKKVFNNQEVATFVKDNCLWVFGSLKGNIIDQNKENIVIWGSTIGCGSCHTQKLYIFMDGKSIFEKWLDDPKISVVNRPKKTDALGIIEPIRSSDESLGNPTWGLKNIYEWQTESNSLYSLSTVPVKYNQ